MTAEPLEDEQPRELAVWVTGLPDELQPSDLRLVLPNWIRNQARWIFLAGTAWTIDAQRSTGEAVKVLVRSPSPAHTARAVTVLLQKLGEHRFEANREEPKRRTKPPGSSRPPVLEKCLDVLGWISQQPSKQFTYDEIASGLGRSKGYVSYRTPVLEQAGYLTSVKQPKLGQHIVLLQITAAGLELGIPIPELHSDSDSAPPPWYATLELLRHPSAAESQTKVQLADQLERDPETIAKYLRTLGKLGMVEKAGFVSTKGKPALFRVTAEGRTFQIEK